MTHFTLVTGNEDKVREAMRLLNGALTLERVKLDLPEIQAATTSEVALEKAHAAFEILKRPVIIEDAGVELTALGGFPGPFIKFWEKLGGLESICRSLDGFAEKEARRAFAVCVLGVCTSDGGAYVVEGRTPGTIANEPRGTNGFGWDAIFIPDSGGVGASDNQRTFAEMTSEEKDSLSHRRRAWEQLAATLRGTLPA